MRLTKVPMKIDIEVLGIANCLRLAKAAIKEHNECYDTKYTLVRTNIK